MISSMRGVRSLMPGVRPSIRAPSMPVRSMPVASTQEWRSTRAEPMQAVTPGLWRTRERPSMQALTRVPPSMAALTVLGFPSTRFTSSTFRSMASVPSRFRFASLLRRAWPDWWSRHRPCWEVASTAVRPSASLVLRRSVSRSLVPSSEQAGEAGRAGTVALVRGCSHVAGQVVVVGRPSSSTVQVRSSFVRGPSLPEVVAAGPASRAVTSRRVAAVEQVFPQARVVQGRARSPWPTSSPSAVRTMACGSVCPVRAERRTQAVVAASTPLSLPALAAISELRGRLRRGTASSPRQRPRSGALL